MKDCLKGRFHLPDEKEFGATWIEKQYPEKADVRWKWLQAEDVTWVEPGVHDEPEVSNRMVIAWQHGDKVHKVRKADECCKAVVKEGVTSYKAPKAEGNKEPENQRLTDTLSISGNLLYSAVDGAFRKNSNDAPCFAQGMDPITLQKKINAYLSKCKSTPNSAILCHDVKGWSEYEDRAENYEYTLIECRKYDDDTMALTAEAWEKMYVCVNRGNIKALVQYSHGGIQGLTVVRDSAKHGKLLCHFHYKAKKAGLVRGGANGVVCIDDVAYLCILAAPVTPDRTRKLLAFFASAIMRSSPTLSTLLRSSAEWARWCS